MESNNEDIVVKDLEAVLKSLKAANTLNEEDPSQTALVHMIQRVRGQMLDVASIAFVRRPGNSELLSAINATISQMEKSVRDDRKERAKAQEKEDNRATFNQLFEAMQMLKTGTLARAQWEDDSWFLKPGMSFTQLADLGKIKDDEIRMGRISTDLDGNDI